MRTEYTIMKTDFARCRTSRHMGISLAQFPTKSQAWNACITKIAQLNALSKGDSFFWVKYQ